MNRKRLFFVAGEASSDQHGAALIAAIRANEPSLECVGYGGPRMAEAGMALRENLVALAGIGLDFLTKIPRFLSLFTRICREFDEHPPMAVVLIDYPGLNLRIAKAAKTRGIPVIYFISPQVWAWGEERVAAIRTTVDLMLVVFRFEETFYRERDVTVQFVGHPLLDQAHASLTREELLTRLALTPTYPTVALLPGSRRGEIHRHLPILLRAVEQLRPALPHLQCVLPRATGVPERAFAAALTHAHVTLVNGHFHDCLAASDAAIVASGTATLETALMNCPMLIVYKTTPWTYWFARRVITLPHIGLVNVVAGKQIVPEFLQGDVTPAKLAPLLRQLLTQSTHRSAQRQSFVALRDQLGEPGACARAAAAILRFLSRKATSDYPTAQRHPENAL